MQCGGADHLGSFHIHDCDIGMGADFNTPLHWPKAKAMGWVLCRNLHVMLKAYTALCHFIEHQRHLRFHAREAAISAPDDVLLLFFRRMRGVIGRDHIHHAVLQSLPDGA